MQLPLPLLASLALPAPELALHAAQARMLDDPQPALERMGRCWPEVCTRSGAKRSGSAAA
jgi:hypothetical protein